MKPYVQVVRDLGNCSTTYTLNISDEFLMAFPIDKLVKPTDPPFRQMLDLLIACDIFGGGENPYELITPEGDMYEAYEKNLEGLWIPWHMNHDPWGMMFSLEADAKWFTSPSSWYGVIGSNG